jgi:hypothetical protein
MATNSVESTLAAAKDTLAKANKFTNSVTGNATDAFAPKKPETPKIPQTPKTHKEAPYALARELRAKSDNVDQYIANTPKTQ